MAPSWGLFWGTCRCAPGGPGGVSPPPSRCRTSAPPFRWALSHQPAAPTSPSLSASRGSFVCFLVFFSSPPCASLSGPSRSSDGPCVSVPALWTLCLCSRALDSGARLASLTLTPCFRRECTGPLGSLTVLVPQFLVFPTLVLVLWLWTCAFGKGREDSLLTPGSRTGPAPPFPADDPARPRPARASACTKEGAEQAVPA